MLKQRSGKLEDYVITVKKVEGNMWQGQLKGLPGVITAAYTWAGLAPKLQDALTLYVSVERSE